MDIPAFVKEWLPASNAFDTERYLNMYLNPSVGKAFTGHAGIRTYFENYFIDYRTQTRLIKLEITDSRSAYMEMEFTGEFPGKKTGGIFELSFKRGKIAQARAELI